MKYKLQTLYSQGMLQVPTGILFLQISTGVPGKTSSLKTEHTVVPLGSQSNTWIEICLVFRLYNNPEE